MPRPDGDYLDADWLDGLRGYTLVGPMVDAATDKSVLVSVTPVGEDLGFAVVFLDLDSLGLGLSAQFGGRRNLEIVLMTSDSEQIVTRSMAAAQWTGASPGPTPFADITGAGTHPDVDGVDRIYGHAVVQAQGWHLYAGADEAAALRGAKDSFVQALSVMLVALGAMLVILVVVYRRIAGPIRRTQSLGALAGRRPLEPHRRPRSDRGGAGRQRVQLPRTEPAARAQRPTSGRGIGARIRAHLCVLFENNPQPMWIWEHDTMSFLAVNDAAIEHYGYTRQEFLSMSVPDILPAADAPGVASQHNSEHAAMRELDDDPLHVSGPWRHITKDGTAIDVGITSHSFSFYGRRARFAMITDVTQRLEQEAQLRHLALHDELTGLPNRTLALERIGSTIPHAPVGRITLGVLSLDLDRFKLVNDVHGHAGGDRLLLELAARLTETFRGGDTVARLSGDEFAIVCPDLSGETEAISMAGRVEGLLASPFVIGDSEVFLTASVGISLFAGIGDADDLMRNAESAMYRAKQRGGNRYEIFDDAIRSRTLLKLETNNELVRAIDRDELRLHYQPEIDLTSGGCAGAEALVRWQHPTRGLLAPAHFVPLAEENGFIVQLGAWVLRSACHQAAEWRVAGIGPNSVSVNLSAQASWPSRRWWARSARPSTSRASIRGHCASRSPRPRWSKIPRVRSGCSRRCATSACN